MRLCQMDAIKLNWQKSILEGAQITWKYAEAVFRRQSYSQADCNDH